MTTVATPRAILWVKPGDEALAAPVRGAAEKAALARVFAARRDSPWCAALALLGAPPRTDAVPLLKWHGDIPYFNAALLTDAAAGGAIAPRRTSDGGYEFVVDYSPRALWALARRQWAIARFCARAGEYPPGIAVSIVLGIAVQAQTLRLGRLVSRLPEWLADPESAPRAQRAIVREIQSLQMRRTAMHHVWDGILPRTDETMPPDMPDFFWNDAPAVPAPLPAGPVVAAGPWKGVPVCGGRVAGIAVVARRETLPADIAALKARQDAPLVLVFPAARPQAVEYFAAADAVLFAAGGALAHACTVARDMNIPGVTALGTDFLRAMEKHNGSWVAVDGGRGTVEILPPAA